MGNKLKIVLIGNYVPDRQESMIRFADILNKGFNDHGVASTIWWPTVFFGRYSKSTMSGLGKWLGYIDKYLVFPLVIRLRLLLGSSVWERDMRFHVCDHSNSMYIKHLPKNRTGINCHDVIAIRGGLGHDNAFAPASGFGKILQKWILANLSKASLIACISENTLKQLEEVALPLRADQTRNWRVIHLSFNSDFWPMPAYQAQTLLTKLNLNETKFILHVGSGQLRKNRGLLLDMVQEMGDKWDGKVCYAGEQLDADLLEKAKKMNLTSRVISATKMDHNALVALYSTCEAFVFPSLSEGFGWPVIEAQACGAPVIASNYAPMPEISGGAAIHADPMNAKEFADAFLSLQTGDAREKLIVRGFENTKRFTLEKMIGSYIKLYNFQ